MTKPEPKWIVQAGGESIIFAHVIIVEWSTCDGTCTYEIVEKGQVDWLRTYARYHASVCFDTENEAMAAAKQHLENRIIYHRSELTQLTTLLNQYTEGSNPRGQLQPETKLP